MITIEPKKLLIIGFSLLLVGFILPTLMIMQILESTFLLNFLAYTASLVGLVLGMLGSLMIAIRRKKRPTDDQ